MIQITISKDVSDWNETDGQGLKSWCTIYETETLGRNQTIKGVLANYGLELLRFEDITEETEPEGTLHRRLSYFQVENENGDEDENGAYSADFNVWISTYTETKTDKVTE
jgi:hypothetical protein